MTVAKYSVRLGGSRRFELAGLKMLSVEVLLQAVRDYRKLKAARKLTLKWEGARVIVAVELERLEGFFTGVGANSYLEILEDMGLTGKVVWSHLESDSGDRLFGSRI